MKTEFKDKVKSVVDKYGFEYVLTMFDDKDIVRLAYGDNPSEFLNQFNDLIPVEKDSMIFYVDKNRLPLFTYDPNEKNGDVHINYYRIWLFFEDVIGLDDKEIKGIIKNWLDETYNLGGLTPLRLTFYYFFQLDETYNLGGLTPDFFSFQQCVLLDETYNLGGLTPSDVFI